MMNRYPSVRSTLGLALLAVLPALALVPSAEATPACDADEPYRSADGSCNSTQHPNRGKNETPFIRHDGVNNLPDASDVLSGTDYIELGLPAPRTVSNAIHAFTPDTLNPEGLSNFFVIMGQFIAHDFADQEVDLGDFPTTGDSHDARTGSFPGMIYPEGDPGILDHEAAVERGLEIDGDIYISVQASHCDPLPNGDCEFTNRITHYLDASNIYGSDDDQADGLRSFEGGRLKTSSYSVPIFGAPPFVPPVQLDDYPQTYADDCNNLDKVLTLLQGVPDEVVTCVGDSRGHENVMLTAIHVIWMREHNRKADELALDNPTWSDETVYQEARKHTSALYSHVVYDEWLPALLGSQHDDVVREYDGYDQGTDPSVDLAFTSAAFRIGHTMVPEIVVPRDECLDSVIAAPPPFNVLPLAGGTGGPVDIFVLLGLTQGIDPVVRDMALNTAFDVDTRVEDSIRDIPGSIITFDTLATNINRGRMNGIGRYHELRWDYRGDGFQLYGTDDCPQSERFDGEDDSIGCFTTITGDDDLELAQTLQDLYGEAWKVDAWVGLMSEARPEGSLVGPTAASVIGDQFSRFREGDRYYYENGHFTDDELDDIQGTSLTDVVLRNTGIDLLPSDVLVAPAVEDWSDLQADTCE